MFLKGCDEDGKLTIENQWGIVGDTFIVGCKIPDSVVYPEFNQENPAYDKPKYNNGIYEKEGWIKYYVVGVMMNFFISNSQI